MGGPGVRSLFFSCLLRACIGNSHPALDDDSGRPSRTFRSKGCSGHYSRTSLVVTYLVDGGAEMRKESLRRSPGAPLRSRDRHVLNWREIIEFGVVVRIR